MNTKAVYLDLEKIITNGGTQSRAELNEEVIHEYADLIKNNDRETLPPIRVFFDGEQYWLADGFHRVEASKQAGWENIAAIVEQGTVRNAILFSVGANAEHGLRRNNDDKRRAVTTLLTDVEWTNWSDNQIAKQCKVSQPFVSALRKELNGEQSSRCFTRNGKTHTMKTKNIGKDTNTQEIDKDPNTKEMFNSEQFKEAVKQEVAKSHPELAQPFDQDVEILSYNVISTELKTAREKIADLEKKLEDIPHQKWIIKTQEEKINELDKIIDQFNKSFALSEHMLKKANDQISTITETNNELFLANEKLTCELEEANQKIDALTETNKTLNEELASIKIDLTGLENDPLEKVCEAISSLQDMSTKFYKINTAIEKASLRIGLDKCINENQDKSEYFFKCYHNVWKEAIDYGMKANNLKEELENLSKKNEALEEANNKLKLGNPMKSHQLEQMLEEIQSIFEIELSKKREVRFGKEKANIILSSIKQARG